MSVSVAALLVLFTAHSPLSLSLPYCRYDQGGWNNVRMSLECLIVVAHAMGRTLVIPPQQHLYLLGKNHKVRAPHPSPLGRSEPCLRRPLCAPLPLLRG